MKKKDTKMRIKLPIIIVTACALILVVVFALSSVITTAATTVASGNGTWISGKLTYSWAATSDGTTANGATGSVSCSGNTITVTATNSKKTTGCNAVEAKATTTTVTVTNVSSYPLKFDSLSSSNATVGGVSQGDTIASGATFSITVTAAAQDGSTKVTGTVTVSVSEKNTVTITAAPSPYVSYALNGHTVTQNGSNQVFDVTVNSTITLPSITAPSGYEFKGWRIGNELKTGSSFSANSDYTVFPVIVTTGTDITAANFKVGSNTYTFWEDAVKAAAAGGSTVYVNATEVTLPNNVLDNLLPASGGTYVKPVTGGGVEYVLPAGVTLVVPYNTSTTVHTTTPAYSTAAHVTPSAFRTLTVPNGAKITIDGSVSVDSLVSAVGTGSNTLASSSWNGTPSGPHGKIVMKSGSEMTLNSGANLYCYGYINGDGTLYMKSGAKVYELFQNRAWRGGSATSAMVENDQKVFPLPMYYVQNVEAPMVLYKGATEYLWTVCNMSSSAYPSSQIEFIGTNGMFKLTGSNSDYITKRYHANVDRLEVAAHGNMSLNALNVKITGLPLIGTIDIKSSDYVLPINNMDIVVETGTTSIANTQTYGVAFIPGSKLTVNEGATFNVNAPTYFYDMSEWGQYGTNGVVYAPVGYSTANGDNLIRTADNLEDAELEVNGTVTVSNKLYTTSSGAHIISSKGTGEIKFTTACATGTDTTYQARYTSSSSPYMTYDPITCNNAWLMNGDESYSKTVSTGTSTWKYDKSGEHWYRYLVDFNFNGNRVARDYYCENNDTVTYDASWLTNLGATASNGTAAISGTNVNVTGVNANSTVTLTGTPAEYIPTFVLNEKQYSIYQSYTGNTLSETATIGSDTYYIVAQADSALAVGTSYAAPTNDVMGVTAANHNSIRWNMSGISYTSGDPYLGTVPAGETAQGPVYIYGFYTGVVAHNSWNDQYYDTLIGAFEVLPQDVSATITLLADCGTFEDESGTVAYTAYPSNNITLNLNGYHATGRIVSSGTFTLELNGGTFDYITNAAARSANYKGVATITNSGTMTIRDSAGGGMITADAVSNDSGANGTAVIRNNAGATLSVTGKDSDHLITVKQASEFEETYNSSYGYYAYNYGIYNLGTITALTDVDLSSTQSRTCGVNLYNYNTGVINTISGGHMFSAGSSSIFNYGGTITTIDGVTIDGKNGITNRNIRGGSQAAGWTVSNADIGTIGTITNCHIEVGQYAVYNNAKITTLSSSTLIAHPDSAQVDTRGNGSTASEGNVQCYTVYNSYEWWYNTNVWKQVDSSSGGYTRVNYYKEEEQYRPTIDTITDCEIYAELTSTSSAHGYALTNYGVINKIGGTTNIKSYKHPDNAKSIVGYYSLHNLGGGIIKSIEGTVNVSATGIGAVYNDGQFTTQINYTYANKVAGNITYQKNTYGEPSTINSITCSGTWSCGGSSSYYYALMNSGYIGTINSTGLTLTGGYNVFYNATGSANKTYEINRYYTNGATASTEYKKVQTYVKNLEKGSTIGTINGIKINVRGTKVYQGLNNQGHIGTLSNVTVGFADGATNNTSSYPLVLNGDSRYQSYTETIQTNRTAETDPHLTVSSGIVTRYDRDYTYTTPPTIDVIDNLTVTSIGTYAFRNAGHIGTLKNSTITGTQYAMHNSDSGPYTERQSEQYYSGTSIFATTRGSSELSNHYKKNASSIDLIDNCTITTPANTYAMLNGGHVGTIKNSSMQSGTTTAKAYALANTSSTIREYTRDLSDIVYITANGGTACTTYYGSGGETNVVVYDYDAPVIDLIGEGNTFKATAPVITNTGIITEINSGEGTKTEITESAAKYYAIYNYSACLDARTTTTPYTAATAASTSGTAGTAVNSDTLQPGAQIGTIKNVYINSNGYGILNGDASTGKTPTIGEIGEGTEIYAHCTTAGYHAIYNQANAKITSITGGVFTVTKATTNAYKNNNTAEGYATLISGGDFKGMFATRANSVYEPDNTARQTYPAGKTLSSASHSVNFNNGTTVASGTGYYYINDLYTVTFDMQDHGTAPDGQTVEKGLKATEPTAPTATGYNFGGWYKESGCNNAWNFSSDTVDADTTLYAKWSPIEYTITWKMDDGTTIDTTQVAYGTKPTHGDASKDSTAQYTYTFTGWTPEVVNVTGDAEYTATFSSTVNKYTITWKMDDGTTIDTTEVEYGTKPTHADPTKAATPQYTYTFTGWTPEVVNVTGPAEYTATFSSAVNNYDVTFNMQGHGSAVAKQTIAYGSKVTEPASPAVNDIVTTEGGDQYRFDGWYKEAACSNAWNFSTDTVTGTTVIYAKWTNVHTVVFDNDNGTVSTEIIAEDEEVTVPTVPEKAPTAQYTYVPQGWQAGGDEELIQPGTTVNGSADVTYTPVYEPVVNTYTFTVQDENGNEITNVAVTWTKDDETVTANAQGELEYGSTPAVAYVPTKAPTAANVYTFDGWIFTYTCIDADEELPAGYELPDKYKTRSKGGIASTGADLADGSAATGAVELTGFVAKDQPFPALHGNTVIKAAFDESARKYDITWRDGNGETLKTEQVAYGETPSYTGDTPTKASDEQNTYKFIGWTPEITAVTGEATYTAEFKVLEEDDIFISHSLTATGSLGVNFYLDLETFAANQVDLTDAYLTFSWGTNVDDGNKPFSQRTKISLYSGNTYKGTVTVAAKELNDLITVKLYLKDGTECATHEYHASDYLYKVIADENNDLAGKLFPELATAEAKEAKLAELQDLCKSMLSYAASAQVNFGYNTADLADERKNNSNQYILPDIERHGSITRYAEEFVAYDATDVSSDYLLKGTALNDLGLSFYGYSLLLKSETTYRLYYSNTSGYQLDLDQITLPDNVKMLPVNNGRYYSIDFMNLPAATLKDDIVLEIGNNTLKVNPCSYFYSTLSGNDGNLKCAVSNLCNYSEMAKDYFDAVNGGNNG